MCSMMLSSVFTTIALCATIVASQSTTNASVVCSAGLCLEGFSNTTIGATISAPNEPTSLLLLPGQYTSSTNPQLLHDILTSSSAKYTPSAGFQNATASTTLPLNLALSPGLAVYASALYSGQVAFQSLPATALTATNATTSLPGQAMALSNTVWIAVQDANNARSIIWESVPDISQLPSPLDTGSLVLTDIQSTACSPPCSSAGICTAQGTCSCPSGFTGSSCETCASGFFGPTCQACPSDCAHCDDGNTGTGACLAPAVTNEPSTCNCLNGVCGSNGTCTCNAGWTTASNGTACAQCDSGFFLSSIGECQVCSVGCTSCADETGECTVCGSGYTLDATDKTQCDTVPTVTSTGTTCPDGSFSAGTECTACSTSCATCNGATSNNCLTCPQGSYMFNGVCVGASSTGICTGTNLIADNNKKECDTCGNAKCTSCAIPNFSVASTVNELQCTGCIPGSFLSNGSCVDTCPSGTFISPKDNITCAACDSSCSTCAGSSTFCLSCPSGQFASDGKCVSTCPSGTFTSGSQCLACHADCASCSGSSFTQCTACPADRPVLNNGRCLPTCSQAQFFDTTSGSCQSCDASCSSCNGAGPSQCLACANSDQVLRGGQCTAANCNNGTSSSAGATTVVQGLGVCLSELVIVPSASSSASASLPSITGLTSPTIVTNTSRPLAWWEILLMALGCAFIFLVIVMLWRRKARKQRAKQTQQFANTKLAPYARRGDWRWRLVRFGEKLFGHKASTRVDPSAQRGQPTEEGLALKKLRNAEEARSEYDMDKLVSSYQYSRYSKAPSSHHQYHPHSRQNSDDSNDSSYRRRAGSGDSKRQRRLSPASTSLYSQITGVPRRTPEPRIPLRDESRSNQRFSGSTYASSSGSRERELLPPLPPQTEAERYKRSVSPRLVDYDDGYDSAYLKPTPTGGTGKTRNPFRQ